MSQVHFQTGLLYEKNQPGRVAQRVCFQQNLSLDLFDHPPMPTPATTQGQGEKARPQPREREEKHDIPVSLWKGSQEAPGKTPCANPSPSFYRNMVKCAKRPEHCSHQTTALPLVVLLAEMNHCLPKAVIYWHISQLFVVGRWNRCLPI